MTKVIRTVEIPKELYDKLVHAMYQLKEWGVPVDRAVEIGKIIIDNYWGEKNADKSGG